MAIVALGDRDPQFVTHREADAALALLGVEWTPTDSEAARSLEGASGVWLLPGTPYRDDDAAYAAIAHCRESGTPFLGTCGGFQYACVELARSLAGVVSAAHAESEPDAGEQVVVPLACSLYGEERTVRPVAGTRFARICGEAPFPGFHFCGFGLDEHYAERLVDAGVVIGAHGDDAGVEAIELPGHPFFVATAFQPQVGSAASGRLSPLLEAFATTSR